MSDVASEAKASGDRQAANPESGGIAADRRRSIIKRIERLEEERKGLAGDVKGIYAECKAAGFNAPHQSYYACNFSDLG